MSGKGVKVRGVEDPTLQWTCRETNCSARLISSAFIHGEAETFKCKTGLPKKSSLDKQTESCCVTVFPQLLLAHEHSRFLLQ
jgi:hypothetical protein